MYSVTDASFLKRALITALLLSLLFTSRLSAQVTEAYSAPQTDTLSYDRMMEDMSGAVSSPDYINRAMVTYVNNNSSRRNLCYRVRIYFNNSQNARTVSSQTAREFSERYPSVPVYNQYANPYFKVTVGDFRTKSDAMKFLTQIKPMYASAFLVREPFSVSQTTR